MKGFGIELEPLSEKTLELVRQWRNDECTSRFMEFRNQISEEDQKNWFSSIKDAHYFVIKSGPAAVGLIDLKKIDLENKTAESGLLIGNKDFVGTGIALGASILLLDFAFAALHLNTVTAKISKLNTEAEKYNQLLGFVRKNEINEQFYCWELSKEVYLGRKNDLLQVLG